MAKENINKLRQKREEVRAINPVFDKIVREFVTLEHTGSDSKLADFKLNYNGLNICIEMTRIEPYTNRDWESQCKIENAIDKLIRKVIRDKKKNPICTINVILGHVLSNIKKGTRIKNIRNIEKIIGAALNGRVNHDYFLEFNVNRKMARANLMKDERYVTTLRLIEKLSGKNLPEISFSNPGIILTPISSNDIVSAILHKEDAYDDYKNNREEKFDEVWLCLYLPDTEFGYTIKGAEIPIIESKYDRIYLSEENHPIARLIYNKSDNPKLDI